MIWIRLEGAHLARGYVQEMGRVRGRIGEAGSATGPSLYQDDPQALIGAGHEMDGEHRTGETRPDNRDNWHQKSSLEWMKR